MKILVKVLCIVVLSFPSLKANEVAMLNYALETKKINVGGTGLSVNQDFRKSNLSSGVIGDCPNYNINPTEGVVGLATSAIKSSHFFTCPEARLNTGSRFSEKACQDAIACRQSIGIPGENYQQTDTILNEIIAKDYVKNAIVINGDDMERLETLRKFAQNKYGNTLGSCLGRSQNKGVKDCKMSIIEAAFEERQNECSFGKGCYSKDNLELNIDSYQTFKSKNKDKYKDKEGRFVPEYFKYRIETTAKSYVVDDEKRIDDLSKLVTSPAFKSAKTDQRIEIFLKTVGDSQGRLNDPILGFELGSNLSPAFLKKSDKFKELLKIIDSNKLTKESFVKDFESYRKKRVEGILGNNEICNQTKSLLKICSEATNIAAGKTIKKNAVSAERLSSRKTKTDSGVELFKKILGPSFSEDDFEVLVDARRCISYGITDESGNNSGIGIQYPENVANNTNNAEDNNEIHGLFDSHNTSSGGIKSYFETTGSRSMIDIPLGPKEDETLPIIQEGSQKSEDYQNGIGQIPPGQISSNFTDMFNNNFENSPVRPNENEQVVGDKVEETQVSPNSASSQDKMNDYLMKKLALAEENLQKLKSESELAEADRVKQKKIEEEAALIKDLKAQIADLKVQTTKNATKVADSSPGPARVISTNNSHNNSISSAPSISSGRSDLPMTKPASEKFDSDYNPARDSSTVSARSNATTGSGAILSSINNEEIRSTVLATGVVLTKIDGMSPEKAAQTISNRILELNGTPFFIEEGGMVMKIEAVLKDGKLVLDKYGNPTFSKEIFNDKIGDKKIAAKIVDKKDRSPASITNAADLKRDQEEKMKHERAEYFKLKNLTNGVIKKK